MNKKPPDFSYVCVYGAPGRGVQADEKSNGVNRIADHALTVSEPAPGPRARDPST